MHYVGSCAFYAPDGPADAAADADPDALASFGSVANNAKLRSPQQGSGALSATQSGEGETSNNNDITAEVDAALRRAVLPLLPRLTREGDTLPLYAQKMLALVLLRCASTP